ncbi:hypothetical protein [Spirosoma jeollabukense]
MRTAQLPERQVLNKLKKRLQKVIRTYEKVIVKMEVQLEKVNRMEEDEAVTTLRQTIMTGLDQSRKFLEKAQEDCKKITNQQADL